GRRAHHEEEIPLPHRQPQREGDTQPTERQRKLASACRGHSCRSCHPSLVSVQGYVVSSPMIGMVVALCSTPPDSTSGESGKAVSFHHPFLICNGHCTPVLAACAPRCGTTAQRISGDHLIAYRVDAVAQP